MDGISDAELQLAAALRGIPSEQALIQQRMRRAQGLMDSPLPQGQMVGRVYRASSPLETLAAALNRYQGAKAMKTAEGQYQDLTGRANQAAQAQARIDMAEKERDWRFRQDEFGLKQDAERRQAEAAAAAAKNAAAAQAEAARHNAAGEAQARAAMEQDAWAFGQDATGGGFMYNRKTGQIVPVSPNGTMPGSGTGLKPDQFESDVQAYGRDMEELSKIQTDLATLRAAAGRGNVAGFGPAAGRVPGMLTSEEAVANRQAAARIMAGIIKMTSGQAASEAEVDRLLEANGLGRTATDTQFREGVNKLVAQYDDLAKQRSAKYAPQVVKTYEARGGFTGPKARVGGPAPALSPEDASAKAWAESNPNDPRAAQILQRLKAKGL